MEQPTVFIVDDDEGVREATDWSLRKDGLRVESFPSAEAFLASVSSERRGCLLLDLRMQGMNGLDLQAVLAARGYELPIIFVTGHGDIPSSVAAMKGGALDFVEKPLSLEVLVERIHAALREDDRRHCRAGRAGLGRRAPGGADGAGTRGHGPDRPRDTPTRRLPGFCASVRALSRTIGPGSWRSCRPRAWWTCVTWPGAAPDARLAAVGLGWTDVRQRPLQGWRLTHRAATPRPLPRRISDSVSAAEGWERRIVAGSSGCCCRPAFCLHDQPPHTRGGGAVQGPEHQPQAQVGPVDHQRRQHDGVQPNCITGRDNEVQAAIEIEPDAGLDEDPFPTEIPGEAVVALALGELHDDRQFHGQTPGLAVV